MTSKEKVNKLLDTFGCLYGSYKAEGAEILYKVFRSQYDNLVKDLEILEILKSSASIVKGFLVVCITDNEKVKEWLENDK